MNDSEFSDGSGLETYDFSARRYDQQTGHFPNPDALSDKFYQWSPYSYSFNNSVRYADPTGMAPDDIIVTTKKGKELFTLDDGKKEITYETVDQLYKDKTQWFEPLADNFMPLKSISANLETALEVKHFTWNQIDEFASKDRRILAYASYGEGDWKVKKQGADGYTMSTVDGKPYWSDAIGQIPFAVDYFKGRLEAHGNYGRAIRETISTGRKYANGIPIPFLNTTDYSNGYDNYFILRGALYAAEKYSLRDGQLSTGSKPYIPSNLGNRIWYKDAIPYLNLKKTR